MLLTKPKEKRVVSKSEYAAHVAGGAMLSFGSILCFVGAALLGILTCLVFLITLYLLPQMEVAGALFMMIIGLFLGLGTWGFILGGNSLYRSYDEREEVAPHTRPKPEQLPAKEILLRASTEPTIEQEKTLLRAASGAEQTPQDQLLRPKL